jgi:hypothetical protein
VRPLFKTSYIACLAFSACFVIALLKFPDLFKSIPLKTISEKIEENLNIYLKLFVLLYADDTVIVAESREDLQAQLNVFGEYCKNGN